MNKRLVAVGAGIIGCLAVGVWIYNAAFAPIDDPSYFCGAPDPSPLPTINAARVLQACAAGHTVTVATGQTIAVDLQGVGGIDTSTEWSDVTVSDPRVLSTVSGPAWTPGPEPFRLDEVATYRAAMRGQATLSALQQFCTANFGGHCDRGHRWSVIVQVS